MGHMSRWEASKWRLSSSVTFGWSRLPFVIKDMPHSCPFSLELVYKYNPYPLDFMHPKLKRNAAKTTPDPRILRKSSLFCYLKPCFSTLFRERETFVEIKGVLRVIQRSRSSSSEVKSKTVEKTSSLCHLNQKTVSLGWLLDETVMRLAYNRTGFLYFLEVFLINYWIWLSIFITCFSTYAYRVEL